MRAHEAGWAHAAVSVRGPSWLREPEDPNVLVPQLWSSTARKRDDGVLEVGGVALTDLVAEHGSPAYVLDEADFRSRARAFREAFAAYDVYYAGKAFLCTTVARWIADEGLCLDVCSTGELAVALRAGFDPARIGYHGNNKTSAELERALDAGVGRIIVDSFHEIERITALAGEQRPARVMVRVTAGVEAHTHEYIATAHEDQKFGFSITSGDALEAVRLLHAAPGVELLGLHSHIGSQIFDTAGFEVAARRVLALHAEISSEIGVELGDLDLGGGFGIAYTTQDDPSDAAQLATEITKIVEDECAARDLAVPRLSIEPGRAIAGPAMCTVYEVGTVKAVELDGGAVRTYVSVDGGMSDNIRTALYDADYSCTARLPRLRRAHAAGPRGRQALRGGRHRGQGRVPARRRRTRRPGRGAGHGRVLPLHGQQLQPRPPPPGRRRCRRRRPGRRPPRDRGRPARPRRRPGPLTRRRWRPEGARAVADGDP